MKIAKLFAVFALVLAAGFAATASAAGWDFGTTTLRAGSTGVYVSTLQTALNTVANAGLVADGKFGAKTTTAVKAFQASKGLVADGLVGNGTKAALNAASGTSVVLPEGCVAGAAFSSTTGAPCTTTSTVPGCVAGAMYSSTTGAPCGTSTGSTGSLSGGAGDLMINKTSADVESEVAEGENNIPVIGLRVEAQDSDIKLSNVKVTFVKVDGADAGSSIDGSTRLNRYADEVTVWLDGKEIGSMDVADFNKSGNNYSGSISLSNAVIAEDKKLDLHVAVSALSNIDSADLVDDWMVTVDSIRFEDATGAILTQSNPTSGTTWDETFEFTDLASSGDVKLKITKDSNSPVAQNVEVSDSSSTSNVAMLGFRLKAEGSDMTFDTLTIDVTATGANPDEIADEFVLKNGSTTIESVNAPAANGTVSFNLDDEFMIQEGDTENFMIYAKIKKIASGNFAQGDSLKVDFVSVNAEDKNGDSVSSSTTGSALGENQTFFSEGVNVSDFTSSVASTADNNGLFTKQTYSISYKVTAFGNTYYIPKTVVRGTATNQGLSFTVENSSGATAAVADVTAAASSLSSNASTVGGYYEIGDGETKTFNVTVELTKTPTTGVAGFYRVQLGQIGYDLDQTGTPSYYTVAPAQDYETADRKID